MASVEVHDLGTEGETRSFPNGEVKFVRFADLTFGRSVFQPGWRWSNDVKPIAETEKCMFLHEGYCISGRVTIQGADGKEVEIGPDDSFRIEPGHDAWVVGDEPWIAIDFGKDIQEYAKPRE